MMRARGPDDAGHRWLDDGHLGLVATRLAIVDRTAPAGPYESNCRRYVAAVAGELYNAPSLRRDLEAAGVHPKTHCDTELVVHLLAHEGVDGWSRMRGEFAVLAWDRHERTLLALRDPAGVRPLYEARVGDALWLASEGKVLLEHAGLSRRLSRRYIEGPLFGVFTGDTHPFDGVRPLRPGVVTRYRDAQPPQEHPLRAPSPSTSARPSAEALAEALADSVALRVPSEVSWTVAFSGGLDSGLVAACVAEAPGASLTTLRFPDAAEDEGDAARANAAALRLPLHEVPVERGALIGALEPAMRASERIFANSHGPARYLLAEHIAHAGHRVVLTGEGSDEWFGGYALFWNEAQLRRGGETAAARVEAGRGMVEGALARRIGTLGYPSFFEQRAERAQRSIARLLRHPPARDPRARLCDALRGSLGADAFDTTRAASVLQLHDYLIPCLGEAVEMAHGLEGRPVFLDAALRALATQLCEEDLLDLTAPASHGTKVLLRQASRRLLPPDFEQPPKHPFIGPTWRRCFEHPAGRALFDTWTDPARVKSAGVFQPQPIEMLRRGIEAGMPWTHPLDRLAGLVVGTHLLMDTFQLEGPYA
ncbi:MAG: asparagine synthase-related protein [Myxococcota bacterium]